MKKAMRGAGLPDPKTKGKPGKKRGTPQHEPTKTSRARVRLLAKLGFTQEEIGLLQDMHVTTLVKHYPKELRVGALEADADVLQNLYRIATGKGNDAGRIGIFWAKVRRRWHEVQRVIHGYDPETIAAFVKSVVNMLKRELPEECPGCKTKLALPAKVAEKMYALSQEMAAKLPASEIVPMPRPALASDE